MKKSKLKRNRKFLKRRTKKVRRGGSAIPFIVQDAFWGAADSIRDSYNNLAGNYNGVDSSVTTQGPRGIYSGF
jgi:hypothetical protein